MNSTKILNLLLIVIVAFCSAYAGGYIYKNQQIDKQNQQLSKRLKASYAGYTGGDFTLQSSQGEVSLHDYKGKVSLLYFGYTYCPDVCPTSLATMGEAMRLLEAEKNQKDIIKGLLISIDPERDTLEKLKDYAPYFHPSISGLRGGVHRTLEIATRYGVYYQKVEREEGKDYLMDHTSRIYIVNKKGMLAGVVNHGTTPQELADRVSALL